MLSSRTIGGGRTEAAGLVQVVVLVMEMTAGTIARTTDRTWLSSRSTWMEQELKDSSLRNSLRACTSHLLLQ
jgi:hypothetical protein